jgi:trans-aconitate 2-methyltransferase
MSPHDWNAADYDRTNAGVIALGKTVLDRLDLRGDEVVLDAGCGTGVLTAELLDRLPGGSAIALDASPQMIEFARQRLGDRAQVLLADLADFDLGGQTVDAVFSTATFHWLPDHDRLFSNLRAVTREGGHLVAQCGGFGNIARFRGAALELAERAQYKPYLPAVEPWNFATAEETESRLLAAGYSSAKCWLEDAPIFPEDPPKHLREVILGAQLEALPEALGEAFACDVEAAIGDFDRVDYVRLNIDAVA